MIDYFSRKLKNSSNNFSLTDNRKWVKLIDENNYEVAPKVFYDGEFQTIGFTSEFLYHHGYKPLVEEYCSDENMIPFYNETDTEIIEHWKEDDSNGI